jgi:O-antigen/teichoic acid export membrane protein
MKILSVLTQNQSPKQIVIKNTVWLGLAQVFSRLFKLVLVMVSARLLGPQGFGTFNYVLSIMSVFFLFSDWGINTLIVRDYQQKSETGKYLNTGMVFKTGLALVSLVIAALGIFVFENREFRAIGLVLAIYLFFENVREFSATLFRARQKMEKEFLVICVELASTTAIGIGLLLVYRHVLSLAYAYALGALISVAAGFFIVRQSFAIKWDWDWAVIRYFIKQGTPLVLFGLLGFVFFSTDQIILGHFRGTAEVGYYSIASKLVYLAAVLPTIIVGALSPYLAGQVNNPKQMKRIFKVVTGGLTLLGVLVAGLGTLFSFLIPIFFGAQYLPAIPLFNLLVWVLVFMFPTALLDTVLVSYHKQWQDFAITAFCAALNLVLALSLVKIYGAQGVIIATLTSQSLNLVLTLVLSYRAVHSSAPLSLWQK